MYLEEAVNTRWAGFLVVWFACFRNTMERFACSGRSHWFRTAQCLTVSSVKHGNLFVLFLRRQISAVSEVKLIRDN